jgi:hypothetical protein
LHPTTYVYLIKEKWGGGVNEINKRRMP